MELLRLTKQALVHPRWHLEKIHPSLLLQAGPSLFKEKEINTPPPPLPDPTPPPNLMATCVYTCTSHLHIKEDYIYITFSSMPLPPPAVVSLLFIPLWLFIRLPTVCSVEHPPPPKLCRMKGTVTFANTQESSIPEEKALSCPMQREQGLEEIAATLIYQD